jgi:hypothetical protein
MVAVSKTCKIGAAPSTLARNWRGHWEGNTLVVDPTNWPGSFMTTGEEVHVIEHFTRTGPESLKYEVRIDDPATWTKPWSLMIPLSRSKEAIYEYACHEGNHGMVGILAEPALSTRPPRQPAQKGPQDGPRNKRPVPRPLSA